LIISIIFELFAEFVDQGLSIEEIRQNSLDNNVDTFFLAVFMNTFTAFFVPVSVPIGRLTPEGGMMDALASTPVRNRDLLIGTFFAELIITAPFLCTFTAGIIAILTLSPLEIVIPAFLISFLLLFFNTALGLWIGIFLSRFFFKMTRQRAQTAISLFMSILSLIMLIAIDIILKEGYQAVTSTNTFFIVFPSTWIAMVIFSLIYGFSFDIPIQLALSFLIISSMLVFTLGIFLVERVDLLSSLSSSKVHFTPSTKGFFGYDLKISFFRYFRDQENWSRIILAFSFTIIIFYIFSFFLGEPLQNQAIYEVKILWSLMFFLALLGAASTLIYVEASFFSIEIRKTMPVFLGIPNAIKRISQLKWFQISIISLPLTVGVVLIARELVGVSLFPLLPTIILIYLGSIGLTGILLGIFGFNPVSDENDIMNILNAMIFFFIVIIIEFLFAIISFFTLTQSNWGQTELYLLYFGAMFAILIIGIIFFILGAIKNQESYDLGLKKGIYTNHFLAISKIAVSIIVCFIVPIIPTILFFLIIFLVKIRGVILLYGSILSMIIYYIFSLVFIALLLRNKFFSSEKMKNYAQKSGWTIGVLIFMWTTVLILNILDNRIWGSTSFVTNALFFNGISIILSIFLLLIGAFTEEAFFRRYAILTFEGKNKNEQAFKQTTSILLSAALFSLFHFPLIFLQLIGYFVLGLLLGFLYLKTERSLWYVTVTHFCYNLGLLLFTLLI
jgi:membrane protease YdiL (CAAX protease family)